MELQWPLILFTTFVAWSCGLFATQSFFTWRDEAEKAQMPALVTAFVLMVVGGICVFFHLQHWERIFNGFGHITSGITQELIFVVLVVIAMFVYFVFLRRGEGTVPKWLAILSIVLSAVLVLVAGHSYMMPSRPTWDTVFGPLSLLGAACALGAGTFAAIAQRRDAVPGKMGRIAIVGGWVNAALTALYVAVMAASGSLFTGVGYSFDPTHPNKALPDAAEYSPFASGSLALTIVAIICAVAAALVAHMGAKRGNWKIAGGAMTVLALAGALCLRCVFYLTGGAMFMLY